MNLSEQLSKSIEINKCFICNKKYIKLNNRNDKKSCNNSNCNLIWFDSRMLCLRYNGFNFSLLLDDITNFNIVHANRSILTSSRQYYYNHYNVNIDNYLKEQTLDNLFKIAYNIQKIIIFK